MTHKIKLTIEVDAPTPEQFERYLNANGWTHKPRSTDSMFMTWAREQTSVLSPRSLGSKQFSSVAEQLVRILAMDNSKPELEVYNEIVK